MTRADAFRLPVRSLVVSLMLVAVACGRGEPERASDDRAGVVRGPLGIGHSPKPAQLAALDIDANPAGDGLPAGSGTYETGRAVYGAKCASCHGAAGEGQGPYPRLVGVAPSPAFPFASDPAIPKTIGNYWPYATTLYDYVHRAMPLTAPGSLKPGDVYAVVAYLLAENAVVPRSFVADAKTLPAVKMPAHDNFVRDNRVGGRGFR